MFVKASKVQSANPATTGLFSRLKDPQVWVCAIAAFTLVGLSSGLLGTAEQQAPQTQLLASAGK